MKVYPSGNILSIGIPAWVGTGRDTPLATTAIHTIHASLLHQGHSVGKVDLDASWSRMSEISESLCHPVEMIAMVHIQFAGTVGQKEVTDALAASQDAVTEWAVTAPFHLWDHVKSPEVVTELMSVDDLLDLLD